MVHHLSIHSFRRHPPTKAIAWFFVAAILLEIFCQLYLPHSEMELQFVEIRQRVVHEPALTIQIMGDSVAAGGILTTILSGNANIARNDAIPGSGPPFSYFLLKQEIAAGHTPTYLLLAHSPHTFSSVRFPVLVGRFAYWSELPELCWNSDDRSAFLYGMLTRFSYILSYRDQFKNLLKGDYRFFISKPKPLMSEAKRLAQYQALLDKNQFKPKPLDNGVWPMYKEPFRVSPLNDHYFHLLLQTAKAHGIKVYWITMPVTDRVYQYREGLEYNKYLFHYLDQFVTRGELIYLQRDFLVYKDDFFNDLSHLNIGGAIKFSTYLSKIWLHELSIQ